MKKKFKSSVFNSSVKNNFRKEKLIMTNLTNAKEKEAGKFLEKCLNPNMTLYTINKIVLNYTPKMISEAKEVLNGGKVTSFTNGDRGCYDAEVHEGEKIYFVEVTMDSHKRLEDFYCTCNTGFCKHLSTILWQIAEQNKKP